MEIYAAWPDLTDWSLKNPDLELYTDDSSFVKNGVRHAGFAVLTEFDNLASSNQVLFLLIQVLNWQISGPNRSPKTVKRTESKHLHKF
jgi:hypothetical protein